MKKTIKRNFEEVVGDVLSLNGTGNGKAVLSLNLMRLAEIAEGCEDMALEFDIDFSGETPMVTDGARAKGHVKNDEGAQIIFHKFFLGWYEDMKDKDIPHNRALCVEGCGVYEDKIGENIPFDLNYMDMVKICPGQLKKL